ncbi:hypothetical protein [Kitasatospora sp. NPDC101183]|uniref:hypothetical protein n=1 Tax=Kitasatospora sp. NPDC101183 TaxID=3364100 RepID=UPI0037FA69FB
MTRLRGRSVTRPVLAGRTGPEGGRAPVPYRRRDGHYGLIAAVADGTPGAGTTPEHL